MAPPKDGSLLLLKVCYCHICECAIFGRLTRGTSLKFRPDRTRKRSGRESSERLQSTPAGQAGLSQATPGIAVRTTWEMTTKDTVDTVDWCDESPRFVLPATDGRPGPLSGCLALAAEHTSKPDSPPVRSAGTPGECRQRKPVQRSVRAPVWPSPGHLRNELLATESDKL